MVREQKRSQAQQRMHKEVLEKDTTYEVRFMHDYMCRIPDIKVL